MRVSQLRVDRWNNELVVRQSPAGKKVSTEAEDTVRIRHQATTGEGKAD
jgi:pyrimidine operon attenuation protein/uracil phosphoribosyltransferase